MTHNDWLIIWTSVGLSVPAGIISGCYSGLVVARFAQFEELRRTLKEAINGIDFIWGEPPQPLSRDKAQSLTMAASELIAKGHKSAGRQAIELRNDILAALGGPVFPDDFGTTYSAWQRKCASLRPNYWVIVSFAPWL